MLAPSIRCPSSFLTHPLFYFGTTSMITFAPTFASATRLPGHPDASQWFSNVLCRHREITYWQRTASRFRFNATTRHGFASEPSLIVRHRHGVACSKQALVVERHRGASRRHGVAMRRVECFRVMPGSDLGTHSSRSEARVSPARTFMSFGGSREGRTRL